MKLLTTLTLAFLVLAAAALASFTSTEDLSGFWTGDLGGNQVSIEMEQDEDGEMKVFLYFLNQDAISFKADPLTVEKGSFTAVFPPVGATVEARLDDDGKLHVDWRRPRQVLEASLQKGEAPKPVLERKRVVALGVNPTAPMATSQFAFLVGEWHGTKQRRTKDGSYRDTGTIVWKGEFLLDGMAVQNTSQSRGPGGRVTQWGVDTRVFNAPSGEWKHHYLNAFTGTFNDITWKMGDDGILTSSISQWMEPNGKMADHLIHIELIDETHFRWTADVSWDGGKTWTLENQISDNVRVK